MFPPPILVNEHVKNCWTYLVKNNPYLWTTKMNVSYNSLLFNSWVNNFILRSKDTDIKSCEKAFHSIMTNLITWCIINPMISLSFHISPPSPSPFTPTSTLPQLYPSQISSPFFSPVNLNHFHLCKFPFNQNPHPWSIFLSISILANHGELTQQPCHTRCN